MRKRHGWRLPKYNIYWRVILLCACFVFAVGGIASAEPEASASAAPTAAASASGEPAIEEPAGVDPVVEGNLLSNGGFEKSSNTGPDYWYNDMWKTEYGASFLELTPNEEQGGLCARIENQKTNDARFVQSVAVTPNTWYRLSGIIKAQGVDTEGTGASLSVLGAYTAMPSLYDTDGKWEDYVVYIKTYDNQRSADICARLGGYSNDTTGIAWFDNISLVKAAGPAAGYPVVELSPPYTPPQAAPVNTNASGLWLMIPLFAAVMLLASKPRAYLASPLALVALLFTAAILRVFVATGVSGYGVDIGCFQAWALRMAEEGPAGFYAADYFCDYPPGYLYFLWPVGALIKGLPLSSGSAALALLLKLWPILADLAAIGVLWHVGSHSGNRQGGAGFTLAALYAFSPAVIVSGAAWGQIDAALALGLALTVWRASEDDYRSAIMIYILTVLMKPQALLLGPLGLLAVIMRLRSVKWDTREIGRVLTGAGIGLAACFLLILPFTVRAGWAWLPGKYLGTMASYDYATINAANLYYLMGGNWVATGEAALGAISYGSISAVLMALTLVWTGFLYIKSKGGKALYLAAGLTFFAFFMFAFRMHERYLFPALAFFLLAYAAKRDGRLIWLTAGLGVTMFFNVWLVLRNEHMMYGALNTIGRVLSAFNLALFALAAWTGWELCVSGTVRSWGFGAADVGVPNYKRRHYPTVSVSLRERMLGKSDARLNMSGRDWGLMLALTAVYAFVAFFRLGSTVAPQTWWRSSGINESVLFDLGEQKTFQMLYYTGISSSDITVSASVDGETWTDPIPASVESECFRWKYVVYSYPGSEGVSYNDDMPQLFDARYVRVTPDSPGAMLLEVVFRDFEGNVLPVAEVISENPRVVGATDSASNLIDEQATVPDQPGYMNGTYFDEIYHARTGYEHLHGMPTFETSHPPLGKVFIMLSIAVGGMTPFAWRFPGTLAGVLMIPAMYLMGKQLFKKTRWAFMAAFLMAADCMHLTQTRIATIDSYPVLFIILMFMCMYRYWKMSFFRDGLPRTLVPLALSGVFMAGACASKWIGIYASIGLAAVLFWSFGMRLREYIYASRADARDDERAAASAYPRRMLATILWCVVWFIIVPAIVYALSYIPDLTSSGQFTLDRLIKAQQSMFSYHSSLVDSHPFKSRWWEWPLILKPMWYYMGHYKPQGMVSTILSFGNPAVWWTGLAALLAAIYRWTAGHVSCGIRLDRRDGDPVPAMLLLGFLAQFMPWVLVPRSTFIYHYFASTPFIMLCTVWFTARLYERAEQVQPGVKTALRPRNVWMGACGLMVVSAILFAAFYPFATGELMPRAYAEAMNWFGGLKLPGWQYTGWMFF